MTPGWPVYVYAATDDLFASTLGPEISVAAKAYAPKRTGDLAKSIEFHLTGHSLVVAAHAPYAAWVELGTRPHVILPKNAQALRWYGSDGGAVFARRVNHPGTRPEPYLRPALFTVRGA
jgi:hypothetical protein